MIYRVRHQTIYDYVQPVSVSHHVVRLTPRDLRGQRRRTSELIRLACAAFPRDHSHRLLRQHRQLVYAARVAHPDDRGGDQRVGSAMPCRSLVFSESPAWETVRDTVAGRSQPGGAERLSVRLRFAPCLRQAGAGRLRPEPRFPAGRPLLEAVFDLTARIHQDFRFDPKATEVTTPVETFFEKRRGVCQDFSHLQIACMRSLGLPARYVSGYLRTASSSRPPPPGGRRRLACLVCGLVPRLWLGRLRPHQQLRALRWPHHPGVGKGLQRRQPHSRGSARRRKTQPEGRRGRYAVGVRRGSRAITAARDRRSETSNRLALAETGIARLKKPRRIPGEIEVKLKALLPLLFLLTACASRLNAADPE